MAYVSKTLVAQGPGVFGTSDSEKPWAETSPEEQARIAKEAERENSGSKGYAWVELTPEQQAEIARIAGLGVPGSQPQAWGELSPQEQEKIRETASAETIGPNGMRRLDQIIKDTSGQPWTELSPEKQAEMAKAAGLEIPENKDRASLKLTPEQEAKIAKITGLGAPGSKINVWGELSPEEQAQIAKVASEKTPLPGARRAAGKELHWGELSAEQQAKMGQMDFPGGTVGGLSLPILPERKHDFQSRGMIGENRLGAPARSKTVSPEFESSINSSVNAMIKAAGQTMFAMGAVTNGFDYRSPSAQATPLNLPQMGRSMALA